MKRSKYSRPTRSASAQAAASPRAACATPSGLGSPRKRERRWRSWVSGPLASKSPAGRIPVRAPARFRRRLGQFGRRTNQDAGCHERCPWQLPPTARNQQEHQFQLETEGWEIPRRRASSLTPPTALIASSSPWSRMCLFLRRSGAFWSWNNSNRMVKAAAASIASGYGSHRNSQRLWRILCSAK